MIKSPLRTSLSVCLVSLPLLWTPGANAASLPWVGTADYTAATSSTGDEDSAVGPFDTYDFGVGAAVIDGALGAVSVGDNLTGSFQSFVTAHELISGGGGTAAAPNLNTTGVGGGYELTIAAEFTETITSVNTTTGTVEFDITGGSANLWFDTTPDFNFNADTGFTDVDAILMGTVVGGSGALLGGGLFGVTSIDIMVDSFDANVFDPDTIVAGNSVFTLQLTNPASSEFLDGIINGANSVNGNTVGGNDLLIAADGNLALQAVPVPPAVWLFGSGLLGLVGIARRKKAA